MKMFRKLKERRGFTLAEVLIVVAILAIMTAVAAPNVAQYSRGIRLRELNDSARAVFMAAEHKFTNEVEMGRTLPDDDDHSISSVPGRYTSDGEASSVKMYYLRSTETALQNLMTAGGAGVESTGVAESQLLENNYIVEYNPETGDVYGVFYSEEEDMSDYNNDFYPDIAALQSDRMIGYYGLDNVKPDEKPTAAELGKPTVEIINAEKLSVKISALSGTYNVKACITSGGNTAWIIPETGCTLTGTTEIILDSLNSSGSYGKSTMSTGALQPKYEDSIGNWLSGSGITADGSDMTLTVTFYDENGFARDESVTKKFNPLFADNSSAGDVRVRYGRHLQNLTNCPGAAKVTIEKTIDFQATGTGNYECWADEYGYNLKFQAVTTSATKISAATGVQIRYLNAEGGGVFSSLTGATVSGLELVNPKVEGGNSGAIAGHAENSTFNNCSVYVEGTDWTDIKSDPYHQYTVSGTTAGGLVGNAENVTFSNCCAAVKVNGGTGTAGGLIGTANGGKVENCAVLGHTSDGKFDGLTDNVSGETAGGIVGQVTGADLSLDGTVFSTCSVKGTTANPICAGGISVGEGSTVYTLGKAYNPDDTENTEAILPANTEELANVVDETLSNFVRRYDTSKNMTLKYPVPAGVTLHGDWQSEEKPDAVSGFFYWENEEEKIHILALKYDGETAKVLEVKENQKICTAQDGKKVTEYGYGVFCVGEEVKDVKFAYESGADIDDEKIKPDTDADTVTSQIETILKGIAELNIDGNLHIALYKADPGLGFVTATVSEHKYTFAPDFYAIYAGTAGTPSDVFGVRTEQQLWNVKNALDGNFAQSHDITPAAPLEPIGSGTAKFTGKYDGGSYRIIDAQINADDVVTAGLFGETNGARLENIVLFHPAAAASDFIPLAVKEKPSTVSLSALNGIMLNESLASVDGGARAGGITLPYTGTIENGSEFLLFRADEVKSLIEQYGETNADLIVQFDNTKWYLTLLFTDSDQIPWSDTKYVAKRDEVSGEFLIPISSLKELAVKPDGSYYCVWMQTNGASLAENYKVSASTISSPPTDPDPGKCEHNFGSWTNYNENDHTRRCSLCGTEEYKPHESDDKWYYNETSHWKVCKDCKKELDKSISHNFAAPGSTACSVCGYSMGGDGGGSNGTPLEPEPSGSKYTAATPAVLGGIVGKATGGSITNCVVAGYTLQGSTAVGGIAGESAVKIDCCEANIKFGKCDAHASVGGIVGSGAEISSCYALVHGIESPSSEMKLGGIAGAASEVKNCYVIFSGQTVGYPVANKAEYSTCYYVADEGFCSVTESSKANSAQGKKLEDLMTVSLNGFNKNPETYIDKAAEKSENVYAFCAVFKDGGTTEHYGPVPKEGHVNKGLLVRGPIVGIYEFAIWDNSTEYDGWLSYNKYGKIYDAFHNAKTNYNVLEIMNNVRRRANNPATDSNQLFRGIIINNLVSEQEKKDLKFEVDTYAGETKDYYIGDLIEKEYSIRNLGAYWCEGRDTDATVLKPLNDHNLHDPDPYNSTVASRFKFYIFKELNWNDIKEIRIYYEPETGEKGMIIYADFTEDIDGLSRANLPDSQIEFSGAEKPKIGTFQIFKKYIAGAREYEGLFINALFNDKTYNYCVGDPGSKDNTQIGIIMDKEDYWKCKDYITVLVNNEYFEFTPWEVPYSAANTNIKEYDSYVLAVVDFRMFDISEINNLNIEVFYGKTNIYSASERTGFNINNQTIPDFNDNDAKIEHKEHCILTLED